MGASASIDDMKVKELKELLASGTATGPEGVNMPKASDFSKFVIFGTHCMAVLEITINGA